VGVTAKQRKQKARVGDDHAASTALAVGQD
jgi:hypothetical protein